jgi:flagellar biosynthesis protein FliR
MNLSIDIIAFWLLASRLTGFLTLAPGVIDLQVPKLVRVAVIVWLSLFMTPLVAKPPLLDLGWVSLACALVSEFLFGLGLGLTTRLVLIALEVGGGLIDNELSLSAAQQLAPSAGISGGVMGRIMMFVGLAFFWMSDYLSALIVGIQQSFRVLPLGSTSGVTQPSIDLFVRLAGEVFAAGLIIAAPISLLCFIVTMGLGFLSRSVHQLNVFNESFSMRVTIGGTGVVVFLPLLLDLARFGMERMLPAAADYFRAMS